MELTGAGSAEGEHTSVVLREAPKYDGIRHCALSGNVKAEIVDHNDDSQTFGKLVKGGDTRLG
jgi:dTDP-4-dehydrorhamnose 3,5-epimerase-like enzyme